MPTTFIEKLALAFLEYKRRLTFQEASSGCSSPFGGELCSCGDKPQLCSDAATAAVPRGHDRQQTACGDLEFDQGSLAAYLKWLRLQHVSTKFGKGLDSAALLLRVEHWLEAGDDRHRHGSNLKPYFVIFLDRQRTGSPDDSSQQCCSSSSGQRACQGAACHAQEVATPPPRTVRPGTVHGAVPWTTPSVQPGKQANARGVDGASASAGQRHGEGSGAAAPHTPPVQPAHLALMQPMLVTPGVSKSQGPQKSIAEAATPPATVAAPSDGIGAGAATVGASATPVTPLMLAGGWQQVLEAVAASTFRRSGSGSLRTSRRSIGGSDLRPSRTLSRHRSQQLDHRPTSSAPVTPGISRHASIAANLCTAGAAGGCASSGGGSGAPYPLSQHPSLPHPPSRLHANHMSGALPHTGLSSSASFGSRSLPVSAYSCHQLSRLVEENPWSEDGGAGSTGRKTNCGSEEHSLDSEGESLCESDRLSQGSLSGSGARRGLAEGCNGRDEHGGHDKGDGEEGGEDGTAWGLRWRSDSDCSDSDVYSDSGMDGDAAHSSPIPEDTLARCDFFAWLDHGDGKDLDLACMGVPREKLERERVRYLTTEELAHYEVVVDRKNGLLKYQVSGETLHTFPSLEGSPPRRQFQVGVVAGARAAAAVEPACAEPSQAAVQGEGTAGVTGSCPAAAAPTIIASCADNSQHAAQQQQQQGAGDAQQPQPPSKWIWVCAPSGRLYVAQKVRGQFHHSSFLRGAAVLAAGNLMARHGLLVKLTADSGHYWPQPDHFKWFYQHLSAQGADLTMLGEVEFRTKH